MGTELIISRELGNVCATAAELTAINQTITRYIKSESFVAVFRPMVQEIAKCYEVLIHGMDAFIKLSDELSFNQGFDNCFDHYKNSYLKEVSKPRIYSEEAYEHYLVMKGMDESKTGYPLLKRTFIRLDDLIDKWITNDAWLAMSLDNILKMLQRLLTEIAEMKRLDPEEAFMVYSSAMTVFAPFVAQIGTNYEANV